MLKASEIDFVAIKTYNILKLQSLPVYRQVDLTAGREDKMEGRAYRRRKYLINLRLQLRYMAVLVLCMLVASFIIGYLLYFGIWGAVIPEFSEAKLAQKLEIAARMRDYEQARRGIVENKTLSVFREAKLLSAHEQQAMADILKEANLKLIPRLIVFILAIALASIFISHKIAGPIYRFERQAKAIGEGDLTPKFKLRKGDELKDLADALQGMVDALRNKIEGVLKSLNEFKGRLEELSQRAGERAEDSRIISNVKISLGQFEKELSSFKIG